MIAGFSSRKLARFWNKNDNAVLQPRLHRRVFLILSKLDAAETPQAMNVAGLYLEKLKGNLKGKYSVRVNANWRIVFGWEGKNAVDVDLVDYH